MGVCGVWASEAFVGSVLKKTIWCNDVADVEFSVALSLEEQLLEGGRVPVGPSDWKMDVIVTPDECLQQG